MPANTFVFEEQRLVQAMQPFILRYVASKSHAPHSLLQMLKIRPANFASVLPENCELSESHQRDKKVLVPVCLGIPRATFGDIVIAEAKNNLSRLKKCKRLTVIIFDR